MCKAVAMYSPLQGFRRQISQCRKGSCRKILMGDISGFKWGTMGTSNTAHGVPYLGEMYMNVLRFQ